MGGDGSFARVFRELTGFQPMPWQEALYSRFVADHDDNIPAVCNLPTGLGKTAVVAIWLIALAQHPNKMPRRLVYVVNRRTVVDQTTSEVEKLRQNLRAAGLLEPLSGLCAIPLADGEPPLAISTLRGQFADNRQWSADPARPAVIIGTVDMIGGRLLFSGYRIGFKAKPLHAGFLGQDVLLVHDEAHLEPAFQKLIEDIGREQDEREQTVTLPWPKLRVMQLTATTRNEIARTGETDEKPFELTDDEKNVPEEIPEPREDEPPLHRVWRRLKAKKTLTLHQVGDGKDAVAKEIAKLAAKYKDSNAAVLVFVRTLDDIGTVEKELAKTKRPVILLTGTMRGKERDELVEKPEFKRFLKGTDSGETVYLVCTSAGEVGIDISADHMVCDLSTFESMAQRLGRVNRYGEPVGHVARIDVVYPSKFDEKGKLTPACENTLKLLQQLPQVPRSEEEADVTLYDASPKALSDLRDRTDLPCKIDDAFSPTPEMLDATDILFDAWALTTIREKLPGRPPVEPYLHGVEDEKKAETYIAWRQEVWELRREFEAEGDRKEFEKFAADLFGDYPLKPHELLRDSTFRKNTGIRAKLLKLGGRYPDYPVWIQQPDGSVAVTKLGELSAFSLPSRTVLLAPQAGGLLIHDGRSSGLFDADAEFQAEHGRLYDVADQWRDEKGRPRRYRNVWDEDAPPDGMRRVLTIEINPDAGEFEENEEAATRRFWRWYVRPWSADDDSSKTAESPVLWDDHTNQVAKYAKDIAVGLGLPVDLQQALKLAARLHDLGKDRELFQFLLGNPNPRESGLLLAKSGGKIRPRDIRSDYRHEFGSLLDVLDGNQEFRAELESLSKDMQDVVLHLIAAHHGYARPHFPADHAFDPEKPQNEANKLAAEVPRRFARLQRKYGRWGLAYLESLLRAADWAASANPTPPTNPTKR